MMTYQNFKETVIATLVSYMPEEYQEMQIVCRKKRFVNQEQEVLACSIPNARANTVNICLADAYDDYLKNGHIVAMLRGMAKVLAEKFKMPLAPELDEIMLRNADQKIVFHLINTEQNRELLADVPHREFLDLSIVYELVMQMGETGIAFGMIKNDMARKLSMTEEQLFQHAYENTKKLLRPVVYDMLSMPIEFAADECEDDECEPIPRTQTLWYIGNARATYGTASILYPDLMAELADAVGSDLYLYPSSVHEFLAQSVYAVDPEDNQPEHLADMVADINMSAVSLQDRLSNQVYRYCRATGEITLLTNTANTRLDKLACPPKHVDPLTGCWES